MKASLMKATHLRTTHMTTTHLKIHADENADEKMRVCSRGLPSGRCAYEFGARYCDIGPRMDAWLLAAVSGRTRTVPDYTAYGM